MSARWQLNDSKLSKNRQKTTKKRKYELASWKLMFFFLETSPEIFRIPSNRKLLMRLCAGART
jgi:hypothetical protein